MTGFSSMMLRAHVQGKPSGSSGEWLLRVRDLATTTAGGASVSLGACVSALSSLCVASAASLSSLSSDESSCSESSASGTGSVLLVAVEGGGEGVMVGGEVGVELTATGGGVTVVTLILLLKQEVFVR